MKAKNVHLQYQPKTDKVLLVDHGAEPMLAYDLHDEFLYCVAAWGLQGEHKQADKPANAIDRFLRFFGIHVLHARNTRVIESKAGKIRVTVEHLK